MPRCVAFATIAAWLLMSAVAAQQPAARPDAAAGTVLITPEFEYVMAINVFGALATAEAFRDHVAASREKKIVSLTSRSGIISQPGYRGPSFYRASKVALNNTDEGSC